MPNYVDLGARLLALRKMTFPSADKALSYLSLIHISEPTRRS